VDVAFLLHAFPNLYQLDYFSPYAKKPIGDALSSHMYWTNKAAQDNFSFNHLRHIRGDPSGLFHLALACRVVHLDVISVTVAHMPELFALLLAAQPSRLSIEVTIDQWRGVSKDLASLSASDMPHFTHFTLTIQLSPCSVRLGTLMIRLVNLLKDLSVRWLLVRLTWQEFDKSHPKAGSTSKDDDNLRVSLREINLHSLVKKVIRGVRSLQFVLFEVEDETACWEIMTRVEQRVMEAMEFDYGKELMERY